MKGINELLEQTNKTLNKQLSILCCKLDAVILASGGSPVLYNTVISEVVPAGNTYSSPEAHTIQVMVLQNDSNTNTADVTVNGDASSWPIGVNWNQTATTVFAAGMFTIENTSTADVIVTTTIA